MSVFLAGQGKQFVRSPGRQRDARALLREGILQVQILRASKFWCGFNNMDVALNYYPPNLDREGDYYALPFSRRQQLRRKWRQRTTEFNFSPGGGYSYGAVESFSGVGQCPAISGMPKTVTVINTPTTHAEGDGVETIFDSNLWAGWGVGLGAHFSGDEHGFALTNRFYATRSGQAMTRQTLATETYHTDHLTPVSDVLRAAVFPEFPTDLFRTMFYIPTVRFDEHMPDRFIGDLTKPISNVDMALFPDPASYTGLPLVVPSGGENAPYGSDASMSFPDVSYDHATNLWNSGFVLWSGWNCEAEGGFDKLLNRFGHAANYNMVHGCRTRFRLVPPSPPMNWWMGQAHRYVSGDTTEFRQNLGPVRIVRQGFALPWDVIEIPYFDSTMPGAPTNPVSEFVGVYGRASTGHCNFCVVGETPQEWAARTGREIVT